MKPVQKCILSNSFKSSSQHGVNYGPIEFKRDNTSGYGVGHGNAVIDKLLPQPQH